uniref:Putative secreted protein n=1 Tax=Ixodes ricinus TaxID=34613 RepID=V5HE30_IXORI
MLPFSKMLLVVFAVVLILPALKSGGLLCGEVLYGDCMDLLGDAGDLRCGLDGLGKCNDYDPYFCTLRCERSGRPRLPDGVCIPGVGVKCTSSTREGLRNWIDKLTKQRHDVLNEWCPYFQKK